MKKQILSLAACLVFAAIANIANSEPLETAEAKVMEDTGIPMGEETGGTRTRNTMPAKKMSRTPIVSETVQPTSTY